MPKYQKGARLYGGPLSDIYRGESPDGQVALKIVDLDFLRKPHNFRQEVALMKRLHHPNISEYIDDYAMCDDHVLVMPLYQFDLVSVMEHYLKKRIRFNLEDPSANVTVCKNEMPLVLLKPMARGLLNAVEYLHKSEIIHRDIKPANIFFRGLDSLDEPILGDFGISYDVASPPLDEPLSNKIGDIGTGYYKAPELCFGVTDYGYEVDLWLLAIVFSYMYSSDGAPVVKKLAPDEHEEQPEMNDFVLIQGIFSHFGTPLLVPGPLYWPKMGDPQYHFRKFQFAQYERLPDSKLMPRCTDADVLLSFASLSQYDGRQLIKWA